MKTEKNYLRFIIQGKAQAICFSLQSVFKIIERMLSLTVPKGLLHNGNVLTEGLFTAFTVMDVSVAAYS